MGSFKDNSIEGMVCTPEGCRIDLHRQNSSEAQKSNRIYIKMFSDFICPWCYLSFNILEALKADYDFTLEHVGCELLADTPAQGEDINLRFGKLNKSIDKVNGFEKYPLNLRKVSILPNTQKALLIEDYIKNHYPQKAHDYSKATWEAYLREGLNIGDDCVLLKILDDLNIKLSLKELSNQKLLNDYKNRQKIIVQEGKNMIPYFVVNDSVELQGYVSEEKWKKLFDVILSE